MKDVPPFGGGPFTEGFGGDDGLPARERSGVIAREQRLECREPHPFVRIIYQGNQFDRSPARSQNGERPDRFALDEGVRVTQDFFHVIRQFWIIPSRDEAQEVPDKRGATIRQVSGHEFGGIFGQFE